MVPKTIRFLFVNLPLLFVILLQAVALVILYTGEISGKDGTMINLATHVSGLRFGWPIIFVVALVYHLRRRRVQPR